MRSIPLPGSNPVDLAALAADLEQAETTLALLESSLDPAQVRGLRERIARARFNLAALADWAAPGSGEEKSPFWREFRQDRRADRPSGEPSA